MTPPPPVQTTADEYEHDSGNAPPSRWLPSWGTIQRVLAALGAVMILVALAGLVGYALGRHSVAPRPGEEARLDSAVTRLTATADSARRVAEWEHAQRVIAEQRAAALPRVEIRGPGVVVIRPVGSELGPRLVPVPVEVTAALDAERRVNDALRGELRADSVLIAAERARGDSLQRARDLARAVRYPWIVAGIGGGRDLTARAWDVSADVSLRVSDRWSVRADVVQALARGEDPRARVYAHREWRWP